MATEYMKRYSTWFIISKASQTLKVTWSSLNFISSVISFQVIGDYEAKQCYDVIYILDTPSFCVEAIIYGDWEEKKRGHLEGLWISKGEIRLLT